jgi:hypothetical protein
MEDKNKIKSIIIAIINAIAIFFIFTFGIYCYTIQVANNESTNKYTEYSIEKNKEKFDEINKKLDKLIKDKEQPQLTMTLKKVDLGKVELDESKPDYGRSNQE